MLEFVIRYQGVFLCILKDEYTNSQANSGSKTQLKSNSGLKVRSIIDEKIFPQIN